MRNLLRQPLTWMVIAESIVVALLILVVWDVVAAAATQHAAPAQAIDARAAEGQALFRGHVASHLPTDADVRSLDRGLDRGPRVDRDISAGLELAFDVAGDLEVALDLEASVQAVART